MKVQIITNCLDLLAGFEYLTPKEQKDCFQQIIDVLGSYPKPQKKNVLESAKPNEIACFLLVSNVRNACKLSTFGFIDFKAGYSTIQENCEFALSLLIDNLEVIKPTTIQ
jgi:hypothetical protein